MYPWIWKCCMLLFKTMTKNIKSYANYSTSSFVSAKLLCIVCNTWNSYFFYTKRHLTFYTCLVCLNMYSQKWVLYLCCAKSTLNLSFMLYDKNCVEPIIVGMRSFIRNPNFKGFSVNSIKYAFYFCKQTGCILCIL